MPTPANGRGASKSTYRANRKLDQAEIDELAQRYQDGATTFELADIFGMHRQTVSRYLARAGIPIRSRAKLTPELVAELVWHYGQGQSTVQLGRKYGLAASSVGRALQKAGVTLRPPKFNRWEMRVEK